MEGRLLSYFQSEGLQRLFEEDKRLSRDASVLRARIAAERRRTEEACARQLQLRRSMGSPDALLEQQRLATARSSTLCEKLRLAQQRATEVRLEAERRRRVVDAHRADLKMHLEVKKNLEEDVCRRQERKAALEAEVVKLRHELKDEQARTRAVIERGARKVKPLLDALPPSFDAKRLAQIAPRLAFSSSQPRLWNQVHATTGRSGVRTASAAVERLLESHAASRAADGQGEFTGRRIFITEAPLGESATLPSADRRDRDFPQQGQRAGAPATEQRDPAAGAESGSPRPWLAMQASSFASGSSDMSASVTTPETAASAGPAMARQAVALREAKAAQHERLDALELALRCALEEAGLPATATPQHLVDRVSQLEQDVLRSEETAQQLAGGAVAAATQAATAKKEEGGAGAAALGTSADEVGDLRRRYRAGQRALDVGERRLSIVESERCALAMSAQLLAGLVGDVYDAVAVVVDSQTGERTYPNGRAAALLKLDEKDAAAANVRDGAGAAEAAADEKGAGGEGFKGVNIESKKALSPDSTHGMLERMKALLVGIEEAMQDIGLGVVAALPEPGTAAELSRESVRKVLAAAPAGQAGAAQVDGATEGGTTAHSNSTARTRMSITSSFLLRSRK